VFEKDPRHLIKDAVALSARSGLGEIAGALGREGYEVNQVDSADNLAVHIVVGIPGKISRVVKVTVSEVKD
jgi:hypothetical protein